MYLFFIFLYFCICIWWAIHAAGPQHQEWPESQGPWKENMIWLFLTVFYSIDFIFLYFWICSCWAIHADGPHHHEWPESRGPGKGNCSPFAHFSNTDCGFALYFHKVRMAVGIVHYFYRTRVRSLAMLVSDSLANSLTHWLTHSLLFSKLDWCDPGVWRCQLKTC